MDSAAIGQWQLVDFCICGASGVKRILVYLLPFVWLMLGVGSAQAGALSDRIAAFPNWNSKPVVEAITRDLVYPNWFSGTWTMSSTLVDLVAPLAPELTTPGFEDNQQLLNKPIACQVRFGVSNALGRRKVPLPLLSLPTQSLVKTQVISDRAFNGLNLARAYLGDRVYRVWVDPREPERLITKFRDNRKLFSTVLGQRVERSDATQFLATELFQQFLQTGEKPYRNEVEITTAYYLQPNGNITADQITAVYLLSPHPKAYLAGDRPVALYRYQLEFVPLRS